MLRYKKLTAYLLTFLLIYIPIANLNSITAQADSFMASATPVVGTSDADTAMKLAQTVVGPDITITSAKLFGDKTSFGTFKNGENIIGFSNGIILSNGKVFDDSADLQDTTKWSDAIFGFGATKLLSTDFYNGYSKKDTNPALADALTGFWEESDISGNSYNDPTMLEFTFVPKSDTVSFQYVMASEEYPQYIYNYQDKFLLNVNGTNYAIVPGTAGATTVTIGNINHARNTAYYRGISQIDSIINRISSDNFSFNGETTVLSVDAKVTPNQTATVRMAVCDKNDGVLDTAVFIKANSVSDKQVLYGSLGISSYKDNTITIARTGGSAGYTSADVIFYSIDNTTVLQTINVPFSDGETQKVISCPALAYSAQLANPIGGVKLATTDKIVLQKAFTSADLYKITAVVSGSAILVNSDAPATAASGSSITLKQGNTVIATTQADENGVYVFNNIHGGYYNILVKSQNKSGFGFVKVDQEALLAPTIYLYGNVDINLNDGVPNILFNGLPEPSIGGTLSVNVSVLNKLDPALQKELDNGAYKLNGNVGFVLDFSLLKDGIAQTTLASPVIMTIDIPATIQGKDNYYIYQIYGNGDGKYNTEVLYDGDNDPTTITVQLSKLSPFALIFTVPPVVTAIPTAIPTSTPTYDVPSNNTITPTPTPTPTVTPTPAPPVGPTTEELYTTVSNTKLQPDKSTIYAKGNYNDSTQLSFKLPPNISTALAVSSTAISVKYSSSNTSVATVSSSGLVKAVSKGTATIKATVSIGDKTVTFKAIIKVKNAELSLNVYKSKMSVGDKYTFKVKCNGYDPKNIVWRSIKKNGVSVSRNKGKTSAVVVAKSKGYDYVQVSALNNRGKTVKCTIKVTVK